MEISPHYVDAIPIPSFSTSSLYSKDGSGDIAQFLWELKKERAYRINYSAELGQNLEAIERKLQSKHL